MIPARRGRPPKPPGECRTEVLHVRVTQREFDAVQRRAAEARVKPGDFLRNAIRFAIFREYNLEQKAGPS